MENAKAQIAYIKSWGITVSPALIKDVELWLKKYLKGEIDVFDISAYISMKITDSITEEMKSQKLMIQCGDVDCIFRVYRPHGFSGQWWWCCFESEVANPQKRKNTPESICLSIGEVIKARKMLTLEDWGVRR